MLRLAAIAMIVAGVGLRAENVQHTEIPSPQILTDAINGGNVDAVRKALDDGADPNGAGEGAPTTPLTFAALKLGDDDKGAAIVSLLLSREADPNLSADVRPLYAAILRGSARDAQLLVAAGADPDVAGCLRQTLPGTIQGETAKALAAKKGEPFVSIVAAAHPLKHAKVPKKTAIHHASACSDR